MRNKFSMAKTLSAVVALAAALTFSAGIAAQAQESNVRVGTLTCEGQGGIGLILGSKENLICTYTAANGSGSRTYLGTITRVGLDVGVKGKNVIVWGVLAASNELPQDALVGKFAGVAADASLGLGAGAQVLVGGTGKSIVLQPLSVKAATGINIAVGVAGLTLVPQG